MIIQFSNVFTLNISCDSEMFSSCIVISGVGVLSLLFSLKTDLTGNFSFLSSTITSNSVIDVDKFLIIAEMSFSFFSLYVCIHIFFHQGIWLRCGSVDDFYIYFYFIILGCGSKIIINDFRYFESKL